MIKPICRDVMFLGRKSTRATEADLPVVRDLTDTLDANLSRCVGMAANMIGVSKRIIAVHTGPISFVMLNPEIVSKSDPFEASEGCLSLEGERKTIRYREIEVRYEDEHLLKKRRRLSGWVAQIVQHECDHLDGIII